MEEASATFVGTGLSGLFSMIHAACIYPYAQWNRQAGLGYYVVEGLALILGVIFYAVSGDSSCHQRSGRRKPDAGLN